MKNLLLNILSRMPGVFLPIFPFDHILFKDIENSLEQLDFYGIKDDKINMKKDIEAVEKDLKISIKKAKIEFKSAQ